jgi:16S rRNA A1518/A1519 N6-dimethyltransferase RsmA/KsgA/DIM1 with predicted DNA glycosylase/AP lyase activity
LLKSLYNKESKDKNMLEEQFYLNPKFMKEIMSDIDLSRMATILDIGMGGGDFLDFICNQEISYNFTTNKKILTRHIQLTKEQFDIDCIESDLYLINILKSKNYRVVHNNFLTFRTLKKYDLITMINPFQTEYNHILKALDMQKNGGSIVCVCKADILRDSAQQEKAILSILEDKADYSIKYVNAEVSEEEACQSDEYAILKISIREKEVSSYFYNQIKNNHSLKEAQKNDNFQLKSTDFINQIIEQYNLEVELGIKLINEYQAIKKYLLPDIEYKNSQILTLIVKNYKRQEEVTINKYIKDVRHKYWFTLFSNKDFTEKLTSDMKHKLFQRVEKLINYDFSFYNIKSLQIEMSNSLIDNIEKTVLSIFDTLSHQYSYDGLYSKNVHYFNGWCTNKSWFINKKVIIPFRGYTNWGGAGLDKQQILDRFKDIEKALNFMNGNKPLEIDLNSTIEQAIKKGQTKNIKFNFFEVTFYRAGTAHIKFTNLELLKRLNIYAGSKKSWLPPTYGTKSYDDMSKEEKAVIDDFEGAESYRKVFDNQNYWLINNSNFLAIEYSKGEG